MNEPSHFRIWKRWKHQPENLSQLANQVKYPTKDAALSAAALLEAEFSGRVFSVWEGFP